MNNILSFEKCSGCSACCNVCPTDAISVSSDEQFFSLSVDEDKCVACGRCQHVCPVNEPMTVQTVKRAYGAAHNDENILSSSSSGGAFSALAKNVMARGGVVYGAAYTDDFRTVKMCSSEDVSLDELRRSKYVESNVGYSFRQVKEALDCGREVLYSGAPCQIAGLKRYLGKEYDGLLTCDFSCGGMPSHKLYNEYLDMVEKILKSPVSEVNFRPKTYGWQCHAIKIKGENGKVYSRPAMADPYFDAFISKHLTIRDYCLECEFADNHYADIILADFWKYRTISKIRNYNGISLIIANSEKGVKAVEALSEQMALTVLDVEKASYNLRGKCFSEKEREARIEFLNRCERDGFAVAVKDNKLRNAMVFRLKFAAKKLLGRV